MDWAAVQAAADLLIDGCIRTSASGALSVVLDVSPSRAELVISSNGSPLDAARIADARLAPSEWNEVGPLGPHLAIVNTIVVNAGGGLDVEFGGGGTIVITVFVPIPSAT